VVWTAEASSWKKDLAHNWMYQLLLASVPHLVLTQHHLHPSQVLCSDYGYRSGVGRMYQSADGTIPVSGFELAVRAACVTLLVHGRHCVDCMLLAGSWRTVGMLLACW